MQRVEKRCSKSHVFLIFFFFLGEKATKWETPDHDVDGLTTNGVLIMHPRGVFCNASIAAEENGPPTPGSPGGGGEGEGDNPGVRKKEPPAKPGIWREISVGGNVFGLRESRSAAVQGSPVPEESGVLVDGTLIDLCGATLLWRSEKGEGDRM